jgi:CheY-like chemotaxis protein
VNGLEALEKYKAAPSRYFLVLMDMNMPARSILLAYCSSAPLTLALRSWMASNLLRKFATTNSASISAGSTLLLSLELQAQKQEVAQKTLA